MKENKMYGMIEIRKSKGLSQIELAELTGEDQAEISKIENKVSNPTRKRLEKIADALGVSVKELY